MSEGTNPIPSAGGCYAVKQPALVIDPSQDRVDLFLAALAPEIDFSQIDNTNSAFNAVQSFMATKYSICFVSSYLSIEERNSVVNDIRTMGGRGPVLLIALHDSKSPQLPPEEMERLGLVMSFPYGPSAEDKAQLIARIKEFIEGPLQMGTDLNRYTERMLKEIDKVSNNLKRGIKSKLNSIVAGHVKDSMAQDLTLSSTYYDALTEKSETVQAPLAASYQVPEVVVNKSLPKLEKDGYKGVSDRVFTKLSKKFGGKAN